MVPNNEGSAKAAATPSKAWFMLAVVFYLCVVTPMLWFSIPPLAGTIMGKIPGTVPYDIFATGNPAMMGRFGQLMSIMSFAALVAAIFVPSLVRKLGVKTVMLIAAALIVAGSFVAAVSGTSFNILFASRLITGVGVGMAAVSSPTCISLWFSDKSRALAMAIWSTWVPVGMLIVFNTAPQVARRFGIHAVWWGILVLAVIAFLLIAVVYRNPRADEATEVSTESRPFKEVWPFLRSRQLLALAVAWLVFNFVNYCFTTYNVAFFQEGWGMDAARASLVGSIASACGIIAPFFGAVSDRIQRDKKYLMIVVGSIALLLAACFGFKTGGMYVFVLYMVFQVLGNAILVATCRPMVPMLVGRGGITAVTFGLAIITILQYLGQIFVHEFGAAVDAFGYATASWIVMVPLAVIGLLSSFFIKPGRQEAKAKSNQAADL